MLLEVGQKSTFLKHKHMFVMHVCLKICSLTSMLKKVSEADCLWKRIRGDSHIFHPRESQPLYASCTLKQFQVLNRLTEIKDIILFYIFWPYSWHVSFFNDSNKLGATLWENKAISDLNLQLNDNAESSFVLNVIFLIIHIFNIVEIIMKC